MHRDDVAVDKSVEGARGIDRRTIAKGVAWTVPVVIVATAAPAAAGSMDVHLNPAAALGTASNQDYRITFTFQSHGVTGTVAITDIPESGFWSTTTGSATISANGTATITLLKKKNRAASTPVVTATFTPTGGATRTFTQAVAVPATPA